MTQPFDAPASEAAAPPEAGTAADAETLDEKAAAAPAESDDTTSILDEGWAAAARSALDAHAAASPYVTGLVFNIHNVGNFAARDFFAAAGSADRTDHRGVSRVLRLEVEKAFNLYVDTPVHGAAADTLSRHRVVVLAAPPNTGKRFAALRLLGDAHDHNVVQMPPDLDVDELQSFEFASGTGYLIDMFSPSDGNDLDRVLLKDLEFRLVDVGSDLVVTVDSRTSRLANLEPYAVTWSEVPDRVEIFRRHVHWYADDGRAAQLISSLEHDESIAQALNACASAPEIDTLARHLATADLTHDDVESLLRNLVPKGVAEWFAAHDDIRDCCHMIAFAVLSGTSYPLAADLGAELTDRVKTQQMGTAASEEPGPGTFALRRSRLLAATQARLVPGYEETPYGRAAVEQVWVDDSIDRAAVLRFAWQEFDALRGPLLDWLRDLGAHPSAAARARGAAAVGELARLSFAEIDRAVIRGWAGDNEAPIRESAAVALGVPTWDAQAAPHVVGLLHHWTTLQNNPRLQWTAAAALGGYFGLRFPDVALRELRSLAAGPDPRVSHRAARSVATLFEAGMWGSSDYFDEVLSALVEWSEDGRSPDAYIASMIFLALTSGSRFQPPSIGKRWPTLLWLAANDERRFDAVTELWRRALNDRLLRQDALTRLRRWVEEADDHMQMQQPAQEVVRRLADGSERERQRLHHHLGRWSRGRDGGSATAAACLASTGA